MSCPAKQLTVTVGRPILAAAGLPSGLSPLESGLAGWKARPTSSTTVEPATQILERDQLASLYNVVLLDDNLHTYDYVIEMLSKLFLFSEAEAFGHAVEVDTTGRTIVITCELDQAEFARDQIRSYGPDWRMPESKGSMRAIIEPATG